MKHYVFFKSKLKYFFFLFLSTLILSLVGFGLKSNSITNFYYYKDKPMNLNLRADKIFVKMKQVLTKDEMKTALSQYSQIASVNKYDVNEKMQFVDLAAPISSSGINDLVNSLNQNPQVEYSSPVFSPIDGSGDNVLQGLIDEILVQFKSGISENRINEYIKSKNLSIVKSLSLTGGTSYVLKVPQGDNSYSIDVANDVYTSGLVNWSEPNFYFSGLLCYVPNDYFFPRQWSIRNLGNNIPEGITGTVGCDMRVDSAWNLTLGVSQCIVGMVDSGIDTTHEDIKANLLNSLGYDFINNHAYQTDDMNHGTCTGGIVGAVGNNTIGISGIAPNVKLIGIKIFNASGSTSSTAITNGLIYSYQKGEWISSNSWGGGSPISAADQAITDGTNLGRAGKGTVFCFATGNNNGSLSWPSTHSNVIAVGGVSPCNTRKSTTSCDGESWWGANYGTGLHIVSPCVKIYATDRMGSVGYTTTNYDSTFSGTSSATPNAAGVCALSLSLDSNQHWDTVRVRLCRTANKVGTYSYTSSGPLSILGNVWNNEMGYGKVNAYNLLKLTQQSMGPVISHTPLQNTEQITGSYVVNCVITPSGSPVVLSSTKLYWSKNNPNITDSVTFTNPGGNNYTASITSTGVGTYRYYVKTKDNLNRVATAPYGAPSSLYSFLALADTVKPVIVTTPLPNTPKANWPPTVSAVVTDNIGIDSVWVKWYKNTPSVIKQFKLSKTSGNNYSAAFNSTQADVNFDDLIFYRIFAIDSSSGHNRDSSALYTFKITNQIVSCIGTGTASSNYPFTTYWMDGRTQMLYLASEITAANGVAGNIMRIGFNVISADTGTMNEFNIKFKNTSATSITTAFDSVLMATCYTGTYRVPGTGWQYITLDIPFAWDGASNLLVEICYDNKAFSNYSRVYATSNSGKTFAVYHDNSHGCTMSDGAAQTNRPNICLDITIVSGVQNMTNLIPDKYTLSQNYPNPFNPVTKINFAIPKQGLVTLKIYDILGREIRTLVNDVKLAGTYSVDFNAAEFSSGVYFYRLESNEFSDVKRMLLIK